MKRPGLRVYVARQANGARVGFLMRKQELLFEEAPPAAIGSSNQELFDQLEGQLLGRLGAGDSLERYLWEEEFTVNRIRVEVQPATFVDKEAVIGKRGVPIELCYAWSALPSGAFRIVLPRYRWWILVEELSLAPDVIRRAVATTLMGENARWAYEFRGAEQELVLPWEPPSLLRGPRRKQRTGGDTDDEPLTLEKVAVDWLEAAAKRRLSHPLGPHSLDPELGRLVGQAKLNSLLVVGRPGVGKTTLVKRLAFAALARKREKLSAPVIWETSADRILAGMMYVGMWQERVFDLMQELSAEPAWLYVGSLPELLQRQQDGSSIGELMTPKVLAGELSLIAEATPEELVSCKRSAPRLLNRFKVLRLDEPTGPELMSLLEVALARAGQSADGAALRRLIEHLDSFRRDACFPGKAFSFVDWLARQPASNTGGEVARISASRMSELYSQHSGLPVRLISDTYSATAAEVARDLATQVIGQPRACLAAAQVVARLKAKLNDPERPLGSLLLIGPTGVGKTELAKRLAALLFGDEQRLIRFDMGEFSFPGSSDRLLAVGRGVRSLAEQVRRQPLCVVLLDEIEKAHAETFDLLLAVIGEGRMTDSLGRLVDFRSALILMTSNLGSGGPRAVGFSEVAKPAGSQAGAGRSLDAERAARDFFRPEFFNRIDQIVSFGPLGATELLRIVDLELERVRARSGLSQRGIRVEISDAARGFLAEHGYHPSFGARPLKRLVEELVVTPLAARLAAEPTLERQRASFDVEDAELKLSLTPLPPIQ